MFQCMRMTTPFGGQKSARIWNLYIHTCFWAFSQTFTCSAVLEKFEDCNTEILFFVMLLIHNSVKTDKNSIKHIPSDINSELELCFRIINCFSASNIERTLCFSIHFFFRVRLCNRITKLFVLKSPT